MTRREVLAWLAARRPVPPDALRAGIQAVGSDPRSEEHTSELQSPCNPVCRLLLEKTYNYARCNILYLGVNGPTHLYILSFDRALTHSSTDLQLMLFYVSLHDTRCIDQVLLPVSST